jgi:hypothetical protein
MFLAVPFGFIQTVAAKNRKESGLFGSLLTGLLGPSSKLKTTKVTKPECLSNNNLKIL